MEKKLSVEGMTCQHCVRRVVKIIEKAPGVSNVQVSLENKEAVFSCEYPDAIVDEIVLAINDFGFIAAKKD
jgi:copper ion binding protein